MRIALDERFSAVAHQCIPGHDIVFYKSGVPSGRFAEPDEFLDQVGNAHVLGCGGGGPWPFDDRIVSALPNLKFIHKIGTGINWFDLDALNRRGVLLANNAGLNAVSVADHIIMLMLMCLRNAFEPMQRLKQGGWMFVQPADIIEVEDVTVGIVGFGNIGSHVARRLASFAPRGILVHKRRPLDPGAAAGVLSATLDQLLVRSDVVILCVPLTAETEKLIADKQLASMKPGSILINASRGRIVDESALYDALASGHLRAAASDVFEQEPPDADNRLIALPNFIGTPHMAGRSRRNSPRQLEQALRNINLFLAGGRPEGLVNPECWHGSGEKEPTR